MVDFFFSFAHVVTTLIGFGDPPSPKFVLIFILDVKFNSKTKYWFVVLPQIYRIQLKKRAICHLALFGRVQLKNETNNNHKLVQIHHHKF